MQKTVHRYYVVVGCGRLGADLAGQLSRAGHSVVVIDVNEEKFASLAVDFGGFRLEGDATEIDLLRRAKTDKADCLIAVTDDDNVNLTVAQVAKHVFEVKEVLACVSDPERTAVFRDLGVDTVCPLTLACNHLLSHAIRDLREESPE